MIRFTPFVFAGLLAIPLGAQTKHTLRYQLQPGAVAWQHSDQTSTMVMNMAGRENKMTQNQATWSEVKITEVKDGIAALASRCARLTIKSEAMMGMGKVDYDSDVADSKPGPMKDMATMVGKTTKAKVDATGKILEVQQPDDVAENIAANMEQSFKQTFLALPADPVGIGETWQSQFSMPMDRMGTGTCKITNKLIDVKDTIITIEQTMTMDTSDMELPPGMSMEMVKGVGTIKLDLREPAPIEATMAMDLKMGMGQAPMNMQMRMVSKKVDAPAAKPAATPADAPKGK
jgi:hypothetical protein